MIHVRIPARALVLIIDGKRARFLRNKGNALHIELITERKLEHENPPTREQGTDRPGRYLGVDRVSRSAVEQTDWHQQAEDRFAVAVADILYRMAHGHTFDHLIIVAPAKVLGKLRAAWHPEVATRVVGEVPKELTSRSATELAKLLG